MAAAALLASVNMLVGVRFSMEYLGDRSRA
jgi:hypothetical protein